MSARIYAIGEKVEVKGSNSWFPATVFRFNEESGNNLMIQYSEIDDPDVDSVPVAMVRPAPPQANRAIFQVGNFIEVFEGSKGWRSGKIVGFCEDSRCAVVFRGEEKATSVSFRNLRPCLHWIKASWISHAVHRVILQRRNQVDEQEIATNKLQKRKYVHSAQTGRIKKKMKKLCML